MEKLYGAVRCGIHDGIVDVIVDGHRAHGLIAVGQRLGHGHDIRLDVEGLRGKRRAEPAESANDFVEHEQNAVGIADFPNTFKVTLGRHQHAGGSRNGFDKTRGDRVRSVHCGDPFQIVRKVRAFIRLTAGKRILGQPGVTHVRDTAHADPEGVTVFHQAGERYTADVDTVVGALAGYEAHAHTFTARTVVRECDFDCGFHSLGPRVAEKNPVDAFRRQFRHPARELELGRVSALEWRAVVELEQLVVDRLGDFLAAVTRGDTEQSRRTVYHFLAVVIPVVHAFTSDEQTRVGLEVPVRRKGHPKVLEGIGGVFHGTSIWVAGVRNSGSVRSDALFVGPKMTGAKPNWPKNCGPTPRGCTHIG